MVSADDACSLRMSDKRKLRSKILRAGVLLSLAYVTVGDALRTAWCGTSDRGSSRSVARQSPRCVACGAVAPADVKTEVRGAEGTEDFRRFFLDGDGKEISPWHDLSAFTDAKGEYWMVTEIPKMTKPKMEASTKEPQTPIAQDVKKGKLRDYHGPIFWNYGFFPQTWEDPTVSHPELKVKGDNDPVDVVEIGSRTHEQGEVVRVKVLGVLAMIDDGELDWKVIAIAMDDPLADSLADIGDVESKMPGVISGIREWFRWYKTPDGKPLNEFGFDEKALDRDAAIEVIEETHGAWKRLRNGDVETKLWVGTES